MVPLLHLHQARQTHPVVRARRPDARRVARLPPHPVTRFPEHDPTRPMALRQRIPRTAVAFSLLVWAPWPQAGAEPSLPPPVAPSAEEDQAAARVRELRSQLLRFISAPGWRQDEWGVLVVSLERGDTLFAHNPERALAPASNLKLFTTAVALERLGPDYRFGTYLVTAAPDSGGVLLGDLVVYGTGDPSLSPFVQEDILEVWRSLADSLWEDGIREVAGDLVGDASYFESPSVGLGWQESYRSADYAAPASALSYNDNVVSLQIRPADSPGWRPRVDPIPGGRGIALVNLATTATGGRASIRVDRTYDGPIVVEGRIARGNAPVWRAVPVADPARYAAAVFHEVLEERGIRVRGRIRSERAAGRSLVRPGAIHAPAFATAEGPRVLAVHTSPPLLDILAIVNQRSHNLFAEQVLRVLGRELADDGTAAGGASVIADFLEEDVGVETEGIRILDGSGLSVLNRVTPASVLALLGHMAESTMADAYLATLPAAGTTRGFRRMASTPAEGNLRAKTGTINHVSALSGYVNSANGEPLGFAIISNRVPSTWAAKLVENRIGVQLASFDRPRAPGPLLAEAEPVTSAVPADSAAQAGPAAPPRAPAATERPRAGHTVAQGETLDGIARRYATTVDALLAINPGVEPRRLLPGRTLRLPGSEAPVETAQAPARVDTGEPASAGFAENPAEVRAHTIRPGDTLDAIARRYGVTVSALEEANPGVSPRRLIPGRTLRVPG